MINLHANNSAKTSLNLIISFIFWSHSLTLQNRELLEKLATKFLAFYGTQRFIAVSMNPPALDCILIHLNPATSSDTISLRTILILSSHLCQCFPSDLITRNCLNKILYTFLISHVCATYPANLILYSSPQYLMKSAKMKHHVAFCSIYQLLLCPNILLNTFSQTCPSMFFL